jgi:hypothetical protein
LQDGGESVAKLDAPLFTPAPQVRDYDATSGGKLEFELQHA